MAQAATRHSAIVLTGLALSYPLLTHLGVYHDSVALICAALSVLALLVLSAPLLARRAWAWVALAVALSALGWLATRGHAPRAGLVLFAPPVLLYLAMAWFFGRTLLPGRRPLITRLVWHIHERPPALPPGIAAYTRTLTWVWALGLGGIALTNAALALVATPDGILEVLGYPPPFTVSRTVWSTVANFLSFSAVVALMAGEYAFRWWRFPEERHRFRNVFDFLDRMRRQFPALWRDLAA